MNKMTTSVVFLIFLVGCKLFIDNTTEDADGSNNVVICEMMHNITMGNLDDPSLPNMNDSCALNFLFPFLITFAFMSLIDAITTERCKSSLSKILLFREEGPANKGIKNYILLLI